MDWKRTGWFRLLAGVAVLWLLLALSAGAFEWPSRAYTVTRNLRYGVGLAQVPGGSGLTLKPLHYDRVSPRAKAAGPRPAVVLIHGGGFTGGGKENKRLGELARALARRGHVCYLMNYRLAGDAPPAPAPFDADPLTRAAHAAAVDAKTMLRHVRANAARDGVDPARIALLGESAGAITALAAGISTPEAFASDGPGFPCPAENHCGDTAPPAAIVNLWGTADQFLDYFDPGDPPIMTVHGAKDFTVGISLLPAENIRAECEEHGIPHWYYPVQDAGHGAWEMTAEGMDLTGLVAAFLGRV